MSPRVRRLYRRYLRDLARYWDLRLVMELNSGVSATELAAKYGMSPLTALALERGIHHGDSEWA